MKTYICPKGGDCTRGCQSGMRCPRTGTGPRPIDLLQDGVKPALHFVGFRNPQRFANATRVFGSPDFVHYIWDFRAQADVVYGWDTVVFDHQYGKAPSLYSFDDSNQPDDPAAKER